MPTVCIQCAMEALVKGEQYAPSDETTDEHMKRVHPYQAATQERRKELETLIRQLMDDGKFPPP